MINKKLISKIKDKFKSVTEFCMFLGCSRSYLYKILNGKRYGNTDFWKKVQYVLDIPNEEMWQYISNGKFYGKNVRKDDINGGE